MIRLRLVLSAAVAVVALASVAALIGSEASLEPPQPLPQERAFVSSPLVGLVAAPERRAEILALLGVTPDVKQRADDVFRKLDTRKDVVLRSLAKARRETLASAFCPHDLPAPYRAAILLVSGDAGRTQIVSPLDEDAFGAEWSAFSGRDASALFDTWEQRPHRQNEDSLIALTALVTGHVESAVGERTAPFARFVEQGGSFKDVTSTYADAPSLVASYLANALFIAEIVSADPEKFGCEGASAPAASGG